MDQSDPREQDKRRAIMQAAFGVFAQYGFKRVSMADIAKQAGMSRPALYQHFAGKEDIARSMVAGYYDDALAGMIAQLAQPGPPAEVLSRAFQAKAGDSIAFLLSSPHGMELVELGSTFASDLVAEGSTRLEAALSEWLLREAEAGRISLPGPAEDLAATMLAALDGLKAKGRLPRYAQYVVQRDLLAQAFGAALSR
ncbi:MAG: TetR/AcrR family transcriptional regulator [Pelagimonas sp.]|jgi:AcrR family transcriptional regulator|nr:TetR/AcrR family transcriptional regulator [Pelagimonas sp.]